MASLGRLALILAFVTAAGSAIAFFVGARKQRPRLTGRGEDALWISAGLTVFSAAILCYLLLARDFQVSYVYAHISTYQPTLYTISALWAGQEGSLLLWSCLLSGVIVAILLQKQRWSTDLWPYLLTTLATIQAFLTILLITTQNPFTLLPTRPQEGIGLLPALQHPAMAIHPPIVFLGYALYSVPFAFTLAQLLAGKMQHGTLRIVRKWSLFAWLLLGLGILIGAWWAYIILGWGGYWSWDPVESASLLPWLVGTAHLHALLALERRGILKRWSAVCSVVTFWLCIFSTWVTRGGVVSSALHAFSENTQPISYWLLAFMAAVIIIFIILLYQRRSMLDDDQDILHLLSRESSLLLTNLFFVGLAAAILLGIIFPNLTGALSGTPIYLGSSFYNRVFAPLAIGILFLLGFCTILGWGQTRFSKLMRAWRYPALATSLVTPVCFVAGLRHPLALALTALVTLAGTTIAGAFLRQAIQRSRIGGLSLPRAAIDVFLHDRRRHGAHLVHLAMLLITMGIMGSSLYKTETTISLQKGQTANVGGYALTYEGLDIRQEVNRQRYMAALSVRSGDVLVATLQPGKALYANAEEPVSEVAIRTSLREDLYVALDALDESGLATFRVHIYPLVVWLWLGGGMLLLGTLLSLWPNSPRKSVLTPEQMAGQIEERVKSLRRTRTVS